MAQYEIRDGKRVLKRRTAVPPIVRDTIKRRAGVVAQRPQVAESANAVGPATREKK